MRHLVFVHRSAEGAEEVAIAIEGTRCSFQWRGRTEEAEAVRLPDGRLSLVFEDGRQVCGRVLPPRGGRVEISTGSGCRGLELAEPLLDRLAHAPDGFAGGSGDEDVRALMPGRVVEVAVAPGDRVGAGGLLLVLEAMKMQNEIRAIRGGEVLSVEVEAGRAVESGARLVVLRADSM